MASSQLVINCSANGFTQTLADAGSTTNWKFPVVYTPAPGSPPAEVAEITIDNDPPTTLVTGMQGQTVTGTGSAVVLSVELGATSQAIKIASNPNNVPDCTNELISSYSADDSFDYFQIACSSQTTTWNLSVTLTIETDPELSPPTVSLITNGTTSQSVPVGGPNPFSASGTTLAFQIFGLQGISTVEIAYTFN
jgi:hypothetical protein